MGSFNDFLTQLMDEPTGEIKRIWRVCSEFENIAKDVVEKTEKELEYRKGVKRRSNNTQSRRRTSTCQQGHPLTPESGGILDSGAGFMSTSSYNKAASQVHSLPLHTAELCTNRSQVISPAGTGIDSNHFDQEFAALMGQPVGGYSEIQSMFPNGLTMPWNGNTFHGPLTGDPFSTRTPFDFNNL
jgi:hypothetical protein